MTEEEKELPFEEFEGGYVIPEAKAKALWEGVSFLIKLSQRIKDGRASTQETGLCVIEIADALLKQGIGA